MNVRVSDSIKRGPPLPQNHTHTHTGESILVVRALDFVLEDGYVETMLVSSHASMRETSTSLYSAFVYGIEEMCFFCIHAHYASSFHLSLN